MSSMKTVVQAIQQRAEQLGNQPAFIFRGKDGGRRVLSWQQCYDLGGRWAAVLRSGSIGRGDIVVNTLPNSPERVFTDVGILLSGAASLNGHCQLADGLDVLHMLRKSGASAIILDPDIPSSPWNALQKLVKEGENGEETSQELSCLRRVYKVQRVEGGGQEDFLSHLETLTKHYAADDVKPDDVLSVFTTSGSTGFSKLVVHTHTTFSALFTDDNIFLTYPKPCVDFSFAPLGWIGGYTGHPFMTGYTRVLCDVRGGTPDDMAEFARICIQEERCTRVFIPPAIFLKIAEMVQREREQKVDSEQSNGGEQKEEIANGTRPKASNNVARDICLNDEPAVRTPLNGEPAYSPPSSQPGSLNPPSRDTQFFTQLSGGRTPSRQIREGWSQAPTARSSSQSNPAVLQSPVPQSPTPITVVSKNPNEKSSYSWEWIPDYILLGGYPVTRHMVQAASSLARSVMVVYGATENMICFLHVVDDADSFVDHDAGVALGYTEFKIVDMKDIDTTLPREEFGQILFKSPALMKGYLNDQEATKAALTPNGYFCTGDVGCLDDRGHLIVLGRGMEAIMRGPYIFYPGWLEARIRACPGVRDVSVVGVPDPLVNEELCACLVLTSDDMTVEEVRQFVEKDILASEDDPLSPRPRYYVRFKEFPRTYTDKTDRRSIKKMAASLLSANSSATQ